MLRYQNTWKPDPGVAWTDKRPYDKRVMKKACEDNSDPQFFGTFKRQLLRRDYAFSFTVPRFYNHARSAAMSQLTIDVTRESPDFQIGFCR